MWPVGPPQGIRYVNTGRVYTPSGQAVHLDFVVETTSSYTPGNAALNGLNGRFARISVATSTFADFRLTIYQSCAQQDSCEICEDSSLSSAQKATCYSNGCDCFGVAVTSADDCTGSSRLTKRQNYGCAQDSTTLTLPAQGLVAFSVYDFDGGTNGGCLEQVNVLDPYAY